MLKRTDTFFEGKKEAGFTLIETMIGIAILSIGLLAIGAMQVSAVRNNKTGNTFTQSNALACARMEWIKNQDINDLAIGTNPEDGLDKNGNPSLTGVYDRTWTIANYTEPSGAVSAFARTATVTVTYKGRQSTEVSITSVVTGGGI